MNNQKILLIDVETTGLYPSKHGIIQIAGCALINGELQDNFDFRVKTFKDDILDPRALKVNGVTEQDLMHPDYRTPQEVYSDLIRIISRHVDKYDKTDKMWFMGYNAKFDEEFVRKFFKKNGDNYFGSYFWSPCLDVMQLAAFGLMEQRSSMKNFKLGTVMEELNIEPEGDLHDAKVDIIGTLEMFYKFETTRRLNS